MLGAIVAFIIDKRLILRPRSSPASARAAVVRRPDPRARRSSWNANGQVALGYLFVAAVCAVFALGRPAPREPDPEEVELDREHGRADPVTDRSDDEQRTSALSG